MMHRPRASLALASLVASLSACGDPMMPPSDGSVGMDAAPTPDGAAPLPDVGSMPDAYPRFMGDPFMAPPQCTSGSMWTSGNRGSDHMNPGVPCIQCHTSVRAAPVFSVAGTVYQTAREPNNCFGGIGSGPQITVEITDAMGTVHNVAAFGTSGNFYLERIIPTPYRARVIFDGRARVMNTPQTNGDCNACHGATGSMGAPGRIVLP
jgi:hypothetical protein